MTPEGDWIIIVCVDLVVIILKRVENRGIRLTVTVKKKKLWRLDDNGVVLLLLEEFNLSISNFCAI